MFQNFKEISRHYVTKKGLTSLVTLNALNTEKLAGNYWRFSAVSRLNRSNMRCIDLYLCLSISV